MNVPNILTVVRFILSFIMVFFVFYDEGRLTWVALLIFIAGSITDWVDGWMARKYNLITTFGKLMDPIADKTLTLCALVSFWKLDLLPGLWVAIVAGRDITVTGFRLFSLGKGDGKDPSSQKSGKWKTAFQMLYITGVLGILTAAQSSFWDESWEGPAYQFVNGGMLVVVLFVLWSGVEILRRRMRRAS